MVDPNKVCMGCMQETNGEEICPYCGFSLQKYEEERSPRVLPSGTILNGKYLVGKVIGDGGFGITYLGLDLNLQVPVAIKEYFPVGLASRDTIDGKTEMLSLLSGDRKRFYQMGLNSFAEEARSLAKCREVPGVVSVNEFFYENMTAYLVMEYIRGKSLKKYLNEHEGALPEKDVLEMMRPVLDALAQIHRQGIIHRDISPENIMISDSGEISLIDFGAARTSTGAETKSLTVLLKHGYAPVEQYQTKGKQGPWTDIYAVCATMYRMLSGTLPDEAVERMVEDDVIPLEVIAQNGGGIEISHRVSKTIEKGLSVQARDRYQKMEDLIADLYGESSHYEESSAGAQSDMAEANPRVESDKIEETTFAADRNQEWAGSGAASNSDHSYRGLLILGISIAAVVLLFRYYPIIFGTLSSRQSTEAKVDTKTSTKDIWDYDEDDEEWEEEAEAAATPTPSPSPTPTPTPEPTAELISISEADLSSKVSVVSAEATSTINQNGVDNNPMLMFDDVSSTSWQEGVSGPGIGEEVRIWFSREYAVEYLTFRMGNWKTYDYYTGNNRPKTLRITLGDETFNIQFPDGQEQFCVKIAPYVRCTDMTIEIREVYAGAKWDDTAIADIGIYGGVLVTPDGAIG